MTKSTMAYFTLTVWIDKLQCKYDQMWMLLVKIAQLFITSKCKVIRWDVHNSNSNYKFKRKESENTWNLNSIPLLLDWISNGNFKISNGTKTQTYTHKKLRDKDLKANINYTIENFTHLIFERAHISCRGKVNDLLE